MSIEVRIPNVGESVSEVTLATWIAQDGAYVEMDEPIVELETDKASQELYAETAGVISHKAEEGDDLKIGDLLAEIDESAAKPAGGNQDSASASQTTTTSNSDAQVSAKAHASPVAAKILEEKGIDPNNVKGTGAGGKVTKQDALSASSAPAKSAEPKTVEAKKSATIEVEAVGGERQESRKKMSRLRQTLAKRLVEVKNQTAMLTTFNEIDMSGVMNLRKKYKETFKEKHDIGLGFMSFFTKAVCLAARDVPAVNGKIDGNEIITYNYADVGIAVSTERGLVVPVIRNANNMTLAQIEKSVMGYALKARDNKIGIEDMEGGTFTVTNGGVFGSMLSTPIINGDQSAILGMHNIVQRPVAVNGSVEIRPIMYVALSYDHRIVDGKESVTFLYRVKELIEDPARLLLEV